MSNVRFDQFALVNRDLPALGDWQAAIARLELLVPVSLSEVSATRSRPCRAEMGGRPASFVCEARSAADVLSEPHRGMAAQWHRAYAFGGGGDMLSSLAAGLAAISCAAATGGAFYVPSAGVIENIDPIRQHIDELLAVHCDRLDLYRQRYPASFGDPVEGDIVVTSEVL